jgi:tetratricopeptide (TPR) repeat protein
MMKGLIIAGILWGLGSILANTVLDEELTKAERQLEKKSYRTALSILKSKQPKQDAEPQYWAKFQLLTARCQTMSGNPTAALKTLEQIELHRPEDWNLELATALYSLGKYQEALEAADYYEKDKSINAIHLLMPALWIRAQAQMKMEQFRPCMYTCRRIINSKPASTPQGFSDYKISEQTLEDLRQIQVAANKLLYQAREQFDIKTYGKDFAIYRKARESHFSGKYQEAIDLYRQIGDGTLKEAAGCYIGDCLISLGNPREAVQIYQKMIRENPYGLYRGEMMYTLAVLSYLDSKLDAAVDQCKQLREWCLKAADTKLVEIIPQLAEINDALKRDIIAAAPKTFLKADDCGNLIATAKYPESINNRLTSPWYLPNLMVRTELLYGFLLGEQDMDGDAAAVFEKAPTLTPMQIVKDSFAVGNLKAGLMEDSYLIPETLMKTADRFEEYLQLAFFYFLSDHKNEANKLFNHVIRHADTRNDIADLAIARLGRMHCLVSSGQKQAAVKFAEETIKNPLFDKSLAVAEVRYLKACLMAENRQGFPAACNEFRLLSGSKIEDSSKKTKKSKKKNRQKPIKGEARNIIAPRAMLAMALAAINHGDYILAIQTCQDLVSKYKDSEFAAPAITLLKSMKNKSEQKAPHPIAVMADPDCKVLLHRKIVVMPSATQWTNLEQEVKKSDIIVYQIKFIPRNNCTIIRNVWMNLTPGEPSPPSKEGDEICFVRAPVLFQPGLLYDLDSLKNKK